MKQALRIVGYVVLGIILLFGGLYFFFQTPAGKNWLSKQVSAFAADYLKTTVRADIDYRIPDWIVLENFLIEDQSRDTLLSGKSFRVDLDMWALLQSKVKINQIEMEGVHANIYRNQHNSAFNYQFLLDAFLSDTAVTDTTSSQLTLEVRRVLLKNITANYRDNQTKNVARLSLKSLETGFKQFDLNNGIYDVKDIEVSGINAYANFTTLRDPAPLNQEQNLVVDAPSATVETPFKLNLQRILIQDTQWDVQFKDLAVASKASVERFDLDVEHLDVSKLNAQLASFSVVASKLTYDDLSAPVQVRGLDYGHLALTDFVIDAERIYGSTDSVDIDLKTLTFKEKSGINVQELSGEFRYSPKLFVANNFLFKTPNTQIGNRIRVEHPNLVQLAESIGKARLNIDLNKSFLGLTDVVYLMPELVANPYFQQLKADVIYVDGRVDGFVSNLNIPKLDIRALNGSRLIANGKVSGLPNIENVGFNVNITELSTTKRTLDLVLSDSLKQAYGLPQVIFLSGNVVGTVNDVVTNLTLKSNIGDGKIDGTFQNFVAKNATPRYDGNLMLEQLDVQHLLKNDSLRTVSLQLKFTGEGLEPETMNANVDGTISQAYFNGYVYRDVKLTAGIAANMANFIVESSDVNLNGNLSGTADLTMDYPAINVSGNFQQIDFKALKLVAEPLALRGKLALAMVSSNPAKPIGKAAFQDAAINQGNGFVNIGDISLNLEESNDVKSVELLSDFAKLNLVGEFDYQTLADALLTEVATYFRLPDVEFEPNVTPTNFQLTGSLSKHPLLSSFVPELLDFKEITLSSTFNNTVDNSLTATFKAPYIFYDSVAVMDSDFRLTSTAQAVNYTALVGGVEMSSFRSRNVSLIGQIADNVAGFAFMVKDSLQREVHGLAGEITSQPGYYQVAMQNEGTKLYYQPWQASGSLDIYPQGIVAENIQFRYKQQELGLNSQRKEPNAPIDVTSKQLDLKQLAIAFVQDSTLVSGFFNANMTVKGLDGNPAFTGNFAIDDLTVTQIAVGELKASAANKGNEAIALDASLIGEGNNLRMFGDYNLSGKNPMDFTLDVKRLGAKTLQAFSFGEIQRADGQLKGQLKVTGEPTDPIIRGELAFDTFNFVLKQLGAPYALQNQVLKFSGQFMEFKDFTVTDSTGQKLRATGRVLFPNLPNFSYKLNVRATNFMAVNADRFANDYFFGKAAADASVEITGVNENYTINGDVKIISGSKITVFMPEDEDFDSEMNQLITFVDRSGSTPDKQQQTVGKPINATVLNASSEIILNIEVDEKSELTVLVDELTGDYLRVRGNAQLRTGFNASNELFLYGDYNITDGSYELSVSLAKRKFDLLPGSYIRWTGDPLNGDVNIKAAYTVETSLNGFFENEQALSDATKNALIRPMEIVLLLCLKNNLTALNPSFAVAVREEALTARGINSTDEIRSQGVAIIKENNEIENGQQSRFVTDNYINQQALWLLASGRFSPLNNSGDTGGGFNAEAVARKSVSKLLSDQLNQLASNAIKGVDLNVGVASEYATETGERSTELNLGVSKTLLDNRLTLAVGRNFEFEDAERQSNEIFDNIMATYKLTEDGRYRLKAYRKNQYQSIQGFVVETGVGVVATMDYDKLLEIFMRKEEERILLESQTKKQKRAKRKAESKPETITDEEIDSREND